MAKRLKMDKDPKDINPEQAMDAFQEKWSKMETKEQVNTLLDMVLNAGFKLDMLATAVYTEPTMKEHLDTFSTKINKEMENKKNGNND